MPPPTSNTLLCCDWGSSSFRLHLIDRADGRALSIYESAEGAAPTYRDWRQSKRQDRKGFYLAVLQRAITVLAQNTKQNLDHVPVLISGMASSSIGIKELRYAALPFSLRGDNLIMEKLETPGLFPDGVWLISGVRSETDVMRGEEVQAIGLSQALADESGMYIFPGTHSKHILIEDGWMVDFKTYMTGELFQVTSKHTMLAVSVSPDNGLPAVEQERYFCLGVEKALSSNYLNALFSTRTNQLLHAYAPAQNYYYHSGLHIGYELKSLLTSKPGFPLYLCGGQALAPLYERALVKMGLESRLTVIPAELVSMAATRGMLYLYHQKIEGSDESTIFQ